MKKFLFIPFVLFFSLFFVSCEKEYSVDNGGVPESGPTGGTAIYTLAGGGSACTGAVLNGTYTTGVALTASNTVVLEVDVDSVGTYIISTNTVNGIRFSVTGTFTTTGTQTITLKGTGTPTTAGDFDFSAGTGSCSFSVTVISNVSTVNCKNCLYYPSCVGSKYNYADTINATAYVLASEHISSVDTTIGGVVFQKLKYNTTPAALAGSSTVYYNCSGGVTTLKSYNAVTVGGTTVVESTVRPVKDGAVGDTWTDSNPYPGVPGTTYESAFTIVEKGISRTLAGVTYNEVIHIHLETGLTTGGVYSASSTTEYYYAKGIGLIETETTMLSTGQVRLHQVLLTYFIP